MGHDHEHGSELSETQIRVRALESALIERGLVDPAALDALIETYETKVGPHNGARVVARAWTDPAYRERLMQDATAAIAELGYTGRQGEHMVALENTPETHHMVVCTLCSCYPWPVLGLPPVWYKSAPYRSRAVSEPRSVLADFGVTLPERDRDPRLGLDRRGPLPRDPDAPAGHRGLGLRAPGEHRHARLDDRDRRAVNGAHDMGGTHGFGPVVAEPDEPPFHADWERRVFALTLALGASGAWNIDMSRSARENRPPADYLGKSYYELWLAGLERLLEHHRPERVLQAEDVAATLDPRRLCRARAGALAALRRRRPRAHAQPPPARSHAAPALRARQGRHGRARARLPRLPGSQRVRRP